MTGGWSTDCRRNAAITRSRRASPCAVFVINGFALGACDRTVPAPTPAADSLAVPASVARVAFRIPQESEITDSVLLASVRRGKALLVSTRDSLPRHVGQRSS